MRICRSAEPTATIRPSLDRARHMAPLGKPAAEAFSVPLARSQSRAVPSVLADATSEPSGEKATPVTWSA